MLHGDLADPQARVYGGGPAGEGELDGLVNNAATIDFQKWDQLSISQWRRLAVNVDAPFSCPCPFKSFARNASIVNIASTDGMTGSFGSTAYSASKATLLNVTKSLANLLGPDGIRVNAVAPGSINTGTATDASYAAGEVTPIGRNGFPGQVGGAVEFLLGDDAQFVTGASL